MPSNDRMRSLRSAVELHRSLNGHVLFAFYVLSVAAVLLTNSTSLQDKILLWLVLPTFLAAMIVPPRAATLSAVHPIRRLFGSGILWASLLYIVVCIAATYAARGELPAEGRPLKAYIRWGAELCLFLSVTAYLGFSYKNFVRRFLLATVAMLAINALVNMAIFLHTPMTTLSEFRLSAAFGTPTYQNPTHIAPLFAIYAMAALGLVVTQTLARWQAWLVAVCVPILYAAIVMTQARGALGATLIALLAIALVASKRWRWWIAGLVLVAFDIVMVVPALREALLERGASFRFALVAEYLKIAASHPWRGYGLDRLLYVTISGSTFEQPHNTFVWALVRGGLAAAAAAFVMIAASLFFTFQTWRRTANIAPLIVALMLALTAATEIGFLVFPYNWLWITFWLPVGICAGAELALRQPASIAVGVGERLRRLLAKGMTAIISMDDDSRGAAAPVTARTLSMTSAKSAVLITGASSGIGATYADRFARRGHDLVLVARDAARMEKLAARLRNETGVEIDVMRADLTDSAQLAQVEARLRYDSRIGILVNNAGAASPGGFASPDLDAAENLIDLNVTSVVRLSGAIVPRLIKQGSGAIVNISSALALVPEMPMGIYSATKAFVLSFSQNMAAELGSQGVYVQAVLPAATATEIWERSGRSANDIPNIMDVGDLVDAALVGFDRREMVTIPPLPDLGQWETYEAARLAMRPNFRQKLPADRYRM